ncbi:Hypothetical Protein FCC1311_063252 [Hondaea fermentalgiana]|uniref:Uncharacterized protein n=1 Tax=Hondaea fermentalgiana TaxID=2315210 RepID=A0A2R5GHN9_9STRA|nr:Hypothetical Protein FCC1311_063252 [Hondaea fermentalgiana]|eukprot:GBG30105.1 Hypothetical Protein FCC1311_063252 [Hondaea fermentalgiana]
MRLEQLARKDLERRLERAARRAERAESEVKELREQLQNLQREQRVKDAQLDAVRGDLQDLLLSHPSYDDDRSRRVDQTHARNILLGGGPAADAASPSTPSTSAGARVGASGAASFESKNEDHAALEGKVDDSEDEEDFQDVLAAEMESMRVSYEEKIAVLQQRLEDAQRELKSARLG